MHAHMHAHTHYIYHLLELFNLVLLNSCLFRVLQMLFNVYIMCVHVCMHACVCYACLCIYMCPIFNVELHETSLIAFNYFVGLLQ